MNKTYIWIREVLTGESKPMHPKLKWTFLALILFLLAFQTWWLISLPSGYKYNRHTGFIMPIFLLTNHLAFQFNWQSTTTRAILRTIAIITATSALALAVNATHQS